MLLAAAQASGLVSDVQLVGDEVVCTLSLSDLTASLRVQRLDDAARGLTLEARLPAGEGLLMLSPEKGVGGAVAALSEIEVDAPAVDDAWIIRGDGPALLVALVPLLVPLATTAPKIDVEAERLLVRFVAPVPLVSLGDRVHQALALWERVASLRLNAS